MIKHANHLEFFLDIFHYNLITKHDVLNNHLTEPPICGCARHNEVLNWGDVSNDCMGEVVLNLAIQEPALFQNLLSLPKIKEKDSG